jgi:hypothetical protein
VGSRLTTSSRPAAVLGQPVIIRSSSRCDDSLDVVTARSPGFDAISRRPLRDGRCRDRDWLRLDKWCANDSGH